MLKEILIVDNLAESIKRWGIQFFHNKFVQEHAGRYWFVDVNPECDRAKETNKKLAECSDCNYCTLDEDLKCPQSFKEYPKVDCSKAHSGEDCFACLNPIPLKIAYFIIQARRLQLEALKLSIPPVNDDIKEPELISYIPAGVKFRGKTLKKAEIIPAKLGVVHFQEVA